MAHVGPQEYISFIHALSKYVCKRKHYVSPITLLVQETKRAQSTRGLVEDDSDYSTSHKGYPKGINKKPREGKAEINNLCLREFAKLQR